MIYHDEITEKIIDKFNSKNYSLDLDSISVLEYLC